MSALVDGSLSNTEEICRALAAGRPPRFTRHWRGSTITRTCLVSTLSVGRPRWSEHVQTDCHFLHSSSSLRL
jgi:hypothetical protein